MRDLKAIKVMQARVGRLSAKSAGWIGVDLDGTLAQYDKWPADGSIGQPIPAMIKRVRQWLAKGQDVRIFTARVWPIGTQDFGKDKDRSDAAMEQLHSIREWSKQYLGQVLPVTCVKDDKLIRLYDDRAVGVEQNTGKLLDKVKCACQSMDVLDRCCPTPEIEQRHGPGCDCWSCDQMA